jgi:hypothetical protein
MGLFELRARVYLNLAGLLPDALCRKGALRTRCRTWLTVQQARLDDSIMNDLPTRAWRDLAADWRVWLSLALCLLIATLAAILGYD